MHKTILIAGLALAVTAGGALAQGAQGNPPPPPPPGMHGPGAGPMGMGPMGMGPMGGHGRRGMGERPTPEQMKQRTAEMFGRMDANRDGRVTFEEFRADMERRRTERQRQMFQRFSGGQDSVTLDQLNARMQERMMRRGGREGGREGGPGPGPGPGGQRPATPPPAR